MFIKHRGKTFLFLVSAALLSLAAAACNSGSEAREVTPKTLGVSDAQIVIEAFSDFQCTRCKEFAEEIKPQLIEDYIDTGVARFEYRHYAAIGEESVRAAVASECAAEQGLFWDYHDGLFAMQGQPNSGAFSDEALRELASDTGLDESAFTSCMDSGRGQEIVNADLVAAGEAGISTAPTLVINGIVVAGVQDYEAYQTAVGQAWIDVD